jgi:hypothetical protein
MSIMLLQEPQNQVRPSASAQNQEDKLFNSDRLVEQEIVPQQLSSASSITREENWETLSPINLVKLVTVLIIASIIIVSGEMNNLSCGVSGNQDSTPTLNSK